jgi:adhesin HecA-like repeat protein
MSPAPIRPFFNVFRPTAILLISLLALFILAPGPAFASGPPAPTKTWVGGTGSWYLGSNWSPAGAPGVTDDVTIPGGSNVVTVDSACLAGTLYVGPGSSLEIEAASNGHLTVASGIWNFGIIDLANSGGIDRSCTLVLSAGTLVNTSFITTSGNDGYRTITARLDNQGFLIANHALSIDKASAVHMNSGTIFANKNVDITQSGTAPSFTNTGTINVAADVVFTVTGGTFNHGAEVTVPIDPPPPAPVLQGTGTVLFANATLRLNADYTNSGIYFNLNNTLVKGDRKSVV